jgi:REP element-mobilizing transposase RayT
VSKKKRVSGCAQGLRARKRCQEPFLDYGWAIRYFGCMGRAKRAADGGLIYHVLNRGNARMTIFEKDGDYEAFECILEQAVERYGTEILAWCLMPNHWHLVVKPHEDGELSQFVGWLTLTHTQRWHAHYQNPGSGQPVSRSIQVVSRAGRRGRRKGVRTLFWVRPRRGACPPAASPATRARRSALRRV